MKYGTSLFEDCETYRVFRFKSRKQWLKGREIGIGGSDASAAIGVNRWKDNRTLWLNKTHRQDPEDISDNPHVIYGQKAEEIIRQSFALDFEDVYEVQYLKDCLLQSKRRPEWCYSPDGLLIEKETGRRGILEIKTHQIRNTADWEAWRERIGYDEYYIQVLHGLNVTGFSFVELRAELKRSNQYKQVRTYHIDIEDDGVRNDMEYVGDGVSTFWNDYIVKDEEPALILPEI